MRRLACGFLFSIGLSIGALRAWCDDDLPGIEFSIKPRLCVLAESEEVCEDTLEIRWYSRVPRSLCLYQSNKTLPLRCWENEYSGKHSFALAIAANVEFHLREIDKNLLLVSREFRVVQDHKEFRRRRRNPWSFF